MTRQRRTVTGRVLHVDFAHKGIYFSYTPRGRADIGGTTGPHLYVYNVKRLPDGPLYDLVVTLDPDTPSITLQAVDSMEDWRLI